jgi:hypothetical protein
VVFLFVLSSSTGAANLYAVHRQTINGKLFSYKTIESCSYRRQTVTPTLNADGKSFSENQNQTVTQLYKKICQLFDLYVSYYDDDDLKDARAPAKPLTNNLPGTCANTQDKPRDCVARRQKMLNSFFLATMQSV